MPSIRTGEAKVEKRQKRTKITRTNQLAYVLRDAERVRGNRTQYNSHYGRSQNVITVTDKNGITDLIKIEQIENTNKNTNNEPTTRKSSRIKTVIPIIRYGNSLTH